MNARTKFGANPSSGLFNVSLNTWKRCPHSWICSLSSHHPLNHLTAHLECCSTPSLNSPTLPPFYLLHWLPVAAPKSLQNTEVSLRNKQGHSSSVTPDHDSNRRSSPAPVVTPSIALLGPIFSRRWNDSLTSATTVFCFSGAGRKHICPVFQSRARWVSWFRRVSTQPAVTHTNICYV